ncbi:MAG: hypothetical protein KUG77_19405 [Nannocystaceae bacterium]|nr:hypothetical protein [Nannocystaceae bacterium]
MASAVEFTQDQAAVHDNARWLKGNTQRASRERFEGCLLYTSDAADEARSVDCGGRGII